MADAARPTGRYGGIAFLFSLTLHAVALGWGFSAGRSGDAVGGDGPVAMGLVAFEGEGEQRARPAESPSLRIAVEITPQTIIPACHHTPAAGGFGPPADPGATGLSGLEREHGAPGGQGGSTAPGAPGNLFVASRRARSVVYVIDRSSSMGLRGRLAAASRELLASLSRLDPSTRFQIIVYNDTPELLVLGRHELLPAIDENVRRAADRLATLAAEGGTRHLPALRLALSLGPEAIHFLTDADDLSDADRREVTRLNAGRAVIHTVELTLANRGTPDMPLQRLARENRGSYVAVELP